METMRNKYSEYSGNCLAVQWVRTNAIYSMVAWSIHMLSLFSGFSIGLDIPEVIDFDRFFFQLCFFGILFSKSVMCWPMVAAIANTYHANTMCDVNAWQCNVDMSHSDGTHASPAYPDPLTMDAIEWKSCSVDK